MSEGHWDEKNDPQGRAADIAKFKSVLHHRDPNIRNRAKLGLQKIKDQSLDPYVAAARNKLLHEARDGNPENEKDISEDLIRHDSGQITSWGIVSSSKTGQTRRQCSYCDKQTYFWEWDFKHTGKVFCWDHTGKRDWYKQRGYYKEES